MDFRSPSLLTTFQSMVFCVVLVLNCESFLPSVLYYYSGLKEKLGTGCCLTDLYSIQCLPNLDFFQKAGAEKVYLEIYQTKAEDLPSKTAV